MRVEQLSEDVTLYCGDCREVLPTLGKVDAVVTSPPYDGIRDYGAGFSGLDWKPVISAFPCLLKQGGVAVWNVADQTVNGSETGTSFRQALHAIDAGLRLHDTMIYCKEAVTFPDANRYHPAFEYVFVFSVGAPKTFNGIRDWKNKWGGSKMHGTDRLADGTTKTISGVGRNVPQFGLRRNWWVISNPYTGATGDHPAPMPFSLAADHVLTWTNAQDTVADPFMGSGTTGVACVQLGRKFTGIELEPRYFDIACRRISDELKRPRLDLGEPVAKPVQEALL
jgi:DNA modification methylase